MHSVPADRLAKCSALLVNHDTNIRLAVPAPSLLLM